VVSRGRFNLIPRETYGALNSDLTPEQTAAVLEGIRDAGLISFLQRKPLGTLEFVEKLNTGDFLLDLWLSGFTVFPDDLDYPYMAVGKVTRVPADARALTLENAGKLEVFSLPESPERYMKGVFVHELGHHVLFEGGPQLEPQVRGWFARGRPITGYAATVWDEYFCESLAAYTYAPEVLRAYDAVGYRMIETVLGGLS